MDSAHFLAWLIVLVGIFVTAIVLVEHRWHRQRAAMEHRIAELEAAQRQMGARWNHGVDARLERAIHDSWAASQGQERLEVRVEVLLNDLVEFVNLLAESANNPTRLGIDKDNKRTITKLNVVPGDDRPTAYDRLRQDDPDGP